MRSEPMTIRGKQMLQEELSHSKKVLRPQIVQAIEEARAHGDLSENAEYDAAKQSQGLLEARIRELEDKLARAEVIDASKLSGERVVFGAKVSLINLDTDEEVTYRIVGVDEADLKQQMISFDSPMARQLIGKNVGDEVQIKTPKGIRSYEIVGVEYL